MEVTNGFESCDLSEVHNFMNEFIKVRDVKTVAKPNELDEGHDSDVSDIGIRDCLPQPKLRDAMLDATPSSSSAEVRFIKGFKVLYILLF